MRIIKDYFNDEYEPRVILWYHRSFVIPFQRMLVAKYLSMVSEDNCCEGSLEKATGTGSVAHNVSPKPKTR